MRRTARTVAILLLAPPIVLLIHVWVFGARKELIGVIGLAVWIAVATVALVRLGWKTEFKLPVGAAYFLSAIWWWPHLALLAVCTTGDCL